MKYWFQYFFPANITNKVKIYISMYTHTLHTHTYSMGYRI